MTLQLVSDAVRLYNELLNDDLRRGHNPREEPGMHVSQLIDRLSRLDQDNVVAIENGVVKVYEENTDFVVDDIKIERGPRQLEATSHCPFCGHIAELEDASDPTSDFGCDSCFAYVDQGTGEWRTPYYAPLVTTTVARQHRLDLSRCDGYKSR